MSQRRKLLAVGICLAFGFGPNALVHAKTLVQLTGWDQTAVLISRRGRDSFELTANVSWPRDLTGNLSLQVTMPLGRVENQPLQVDPDQIPRRLSDPCPGQRSQKRAAGGSDRPGARRESCHKHGVEQLPSRPRFATSHIPAPKPQTSLEGRLAGGRLGWSARSGSALAPSRAARLAVRSIPSQGAQPGYFIATTELSNAQAGRLLPDYDPVPAAPTNSCSRPSRSRPSDSPRKAQDLLARLTKLDPAGAVYRLPTVAEWARAAKAGRTAPYWWGDKPENGEAANFLGSEPSLSEDTTASARPGRAGQDSKRVPVALVPHVWKRGRMGHGHALRALPGWVGTSAQSRPSRTAKIEVGRILIALGQIPTSAYVPVFDMDAPTGSALAEEAPRWRP